MIERERFSAPDSTQDWTDPDDAFDLSTPEWQAVVAATPVRRGRPKLDNPRQVVTFRIDADLLEALQALAGSDGRWREHLNPLLREALDARGALRPRTA